MKKMILLLMIPFILAYCTTGEHSKILGNNIPLHKQPDDKSAIILHMHNGQSVTLLEIDKIPHNYDSTGENFWKKIRLENGIIGYVFGDYILTDREQEIVNSSDAYLRKTLESNKEINFKSFRYDSIFWIEDHWEVNYLKKGMEVIGECNVIIVNVPKDKNKLSYNCYS